MKKLAVRLLILLSVLIYGVQLLIFHDPRNTAFYILQDLAFMPITIALATIVVGEVMNQREKEEQIQKTKMLCSTFFTELGAELMEIIIQNTDNKEELKRLSFGSGLKNPKDVETAQKEIEETEIQIHLSRDMYEKAIPLILSKQTTLMILSSNPLLFEHEYFTSMLWGIFHLVDEHRLRGEYEDLKPADVEHLEADFARVLALLLMNWVSNVRYMKDTYPNFFSEAKKRLKP
ncbi:MAG: hypothetical protein Q4B26_09555 [Eubacteriales bacterium]|nr:hypothetical protein [Eubacteriales bacterium]